MTKQQLYVDVSLADTCSNAQVQAVISEGTFLANAMSPINKAILRATNESNKELRHGKASLAR
jgi:hypothetical protein